MAAQERRVVAAQELHGTGGIEGCGMRGTEARCR